jgi:hypothetical protein
MPRLRVVVLATAALLLGTALAHGHDDESNADDMNMQATPQPPAQNSDSPHSYWSLPEHAGLMYMHIALEVLAWFCVLPVGR